MIDPTPEDIASQRKVIYQEQYEGAKIECGRITSRNDKYIFVRFGSGCTSQACDPERLR